jgi:hypothetical protein
MARPAEAPGIPVRLAPRPEYLAGREELLTELHERLTTGAGQTGPRVVALCGLGGAGKTSVAIEYAYRHLAETGACWQLPAETPEVLTAEFTALAAQLGARDILDTRNPVASVHAVLARAPYPWLLIFDNVTSRVAVERFLPPAGNGRVLITTQSQHWPTGRDLPVPVLGTGIAAGFLTSRTRDPDRAAAEELAAELGGLPLALEQAAAYMLASGIPMPRYLAEYRKRQAEVLTRGEATGHPETVAATLALALSGLADTDPAAVGLLRLLAFLAPEPVPLTLLLTTGHPDALADAAAAIAPLLGDHLAIGDAVAALRRYSLITPAGDGLVQVHRLVQDVTRALLPRKSVREWDQAAATLIAAAVPDESDIPATWESFAHLLPHAQAVFPKASDGLRQIALFLAWNGSAAAARGLSWTVTGARHDLALRTGEARDAAGVRDVFAALLPIRERALGPEHPSTLNILNILAYWTGEAGDAAKARDLLAALLPIRERVLGPENPGTLTTRNGLAYWTGEAGNAAEARDLFAALLPIREQALGPDDPGTLTTRNGLACWTGEAGNAAEARELLAALLRDCERVLGPEHPGTLTTRNNLTYWTEQADK